jgi:hypothetical protein
LAIVAAFGLSNTFSSSGNDHEALSPQPIQPDEIVESLLKELSTNGDQNLDFRGIALTAKLVDRLCAIRRCSEALAYATALNDAGAAFPSVFAFNSSELLHKVATMAAWEAERVKRSTGLRRLPSRPTVLSVERRSAKNLTLREFFDSFASTSTPVVITDAVPLMLGSTGGTWDLQALQQHCASHQQIATLRKPRKGSATSHQWHETPMQDFLHHWAEEQRAESAGGSAAATAPGYLFDWPLSQHCPTLLESFHVPSYFANDFLQRTSLDDQTSFRGSWPSLFMGRAGSSSPLHIDALGTHFWMALLNGTKRWRFFDRKEMSLMYYNTIHNSFAVDPERWEGGGVDTGSETPLFALATMRECELHEGELLFVPAGSPHQVRNLRNTVAIAGNYVDESNAALAVERAAEEMGASKDYNSMQQVCATVRIDQCPLLYSPM